MKACECSLKKDVPFTINVTHNDELEKLNTLGKEIASKEGIEYEGYYLFTITPYSVESAKATLLFN